MNQQKVNIHSDNTDDESSMNNDKSVLRVEEKKKKNTQAKPNVRLHNNIIWILNTKEIILTTLQMNYGHQNYFDNFFDKLLYEHIAEQTNLYSLQVTGNSKKTAEQNSAVYWHTYIDGDFEVPAIQDVLVTVYEVFFYN